jgi:hypothetical protein
MLRRRRRQRLRPHSTWIACLLKGLYSLKQGGRKWFRRLEEVLVELGFARIRSALTWWCSSGKRTA